MDTVIVASSQFYSHYPKRIPKGTVNAESVLVRLDSEWDGLTVRIHWLNVASKVEKNPLLERDKPNTIPWEVLTDLGELRMGLVGLDGETVIKPTIWLTYGYVSDGVDPDSGSDPQPPTPSWEQQMVEQAKAAAAAAEASKDAAEKAGKAAGAAAPYAEEAKKSAEAAKESQEAADTSAKQAANAKDQANIASDTAKDHADAAATSKVAAERAAETAGNSQSDASQSAKAAANSAQAAERAKQETQNAAAALPAPSPEFAGMVLMVNPEGNGYIFGKAGGGRIDDTALGRDTTWSSRMIVDSLAPYFEESGPVVTCNPVPGYPLSVVSQFVPVQDGAGDPSPDNVCQISGWDGANLSILGKNLLDIPSRTNIPKKPLGGSAPSGQRPWTEDMVAVDLASNNYWYADRTTYLEYGDGWFSANFERQSYGVGYPIKVAPGGTYQWTMEMDSENLQAFVSFYSSDGYYTGKTFGPESDSLLKFTAPDNSRWAVLLIRLKTASYGPYTVKNMMVRCGGNDEFESYNQRAKSISIQFGQTVYGGALNWATGELTVTHVKHVEDGSKPILAYGDYYVLPSVPDDLVGVFSKLPLSNLCTCTWSNAAANMVGIDNVPQVFGVSTPDELQGLLAQLYSEGNPLYFVYELKNSIKVQLTPAEILALAGTNTLSTDTGGITVSGRADPNAVIKELEDRIAALQGGGGGTMDAQ